MSLFCAFHFQKHIWSRGTSKYFASQTPLLVVSTKEKIAWKKGMTDGKKETESKTTGFDVPQSLLLKSSKSLYFFNFHYWSLRTLDCIFGRTVCSVHAGMEVTQSRSITKTVHCFQQTTVSLFLFPFWSQSHRGNKMLSHSQMLLFQKIQFTIKLQHG